MDTRQAAADLLRRLDLPPHAANVVVNDSTDPAVLTVIVFSPARGLDSPNEWHGHPVRIIFAGGLPMPQI